MEILHDLTFITVRGGGIVQSGLDMSTDIAPHKSEQSVRSKPIAVQYSLAT